MKSVLVMGAGMVSAPLVHYLLEKGYLVTVADVDPGQAAAVTGDHPNGKGITLDVARTDAVRGLIEEADLVISLLPPKFHVQIAHLCLEVERNFLTASYLSHEMGALDAEVCSKNLIFLNETGLDPGLDHLTAMEMIDELKNGGYRILGFDSHCGGLPNRKAATNPLRYKLSWSPAGVLSAITRPAKLRKDGKIIEVPGKQNLEYGEVLYIPDAGVFESSPNADGLFYGERYGLQDTLSIRRGTLRYPGWARFWSFMLSLDFLAKEPTMEFEDVPAVDALFRLSGKETPSDLQAFVYSRTAPLTSLVLEKMECLGLLDPDERVTGTFSAFDIMLSLAERRLQYEPHETDLVILHHEFIVEKQGRREKWTSTLSKEGEPDGISAMAFLVGVPAAVAARLILEDRIQQRGVMIPLSAEFYKPILAELNELGLPHTVRKEPLPT